MDATTQNQIDALMESASIKPYINFVPGIKYNWEQLKKFTPEEYQQKHRFFVREVQWNGEQAIFNILKICTEICDE